MESLAARYTMRPDNYFWCYHDVFSKWYWWCDAAFLFRNHHVFIVYTFVYRRRRNYYDFIKKISS